MFDSNIQNPMIMENKMKWGWIWEIINEWSSEDENSCSFIIDGIVECDCYGWWE